MNGKRDKEIKDKVMAAMFPKSEIATHRREILKSARFKKVLKAAKAQYYQHK